MYTVVLLAAITSGEGSVGLGYLAGHRGYPYQGPACYANHNSGGWGQPYGGYNWPGYACWGGCGGYASAAYGVPMTPLISPAPPMDYDDPEEDTKGKKNGKKNGKKDEDSNDPPLKKGKPKKSGEEDNDPPAKKGKAKKNGEDESDSETQAEILFQVPAGAKVEVDGKAIEIASKKTLTTPALEKGSTYYYEVRVELIREGKPVVETRKVTVRAGAAVTADFRDMGRADVASVKK